MIYSKGFDYPTIKTIFILNTIVKCILYLKKIISENVRLKLIAIDNIYPWCVLFF